MKHKTKIVVTVLAVLIALIAIPVLWIVLSGRNITVAYTIVTDSGNVYMDYYDRPVLLNGNLPKNLKTGDKCLIVFSRAFAESWPEQTNAALTVRLAGGGEENISEKTLDIFSSLSVPDDDTIPGFNEPVLPADFHIRFELWIDKNQRNVLDTYEGYLQKDLVFDGVSKKSYHPDSEELLQLYQFVSPLEKQTGLDFSKPITYDNYADDDDSFYVTPLTCYYLKFSANGKTFEISGDATARECIKQSEEALYFTEAVNGLFGHFINTETYKSMPDVNGGYD